MSKIFVLIITLLSSLTGAAQKRFDFEVKGHLNGLSNDSVVLYINKYDKVGKLKRDTLITTAKNSQFYFKGQSDAICDASIRIEGLNARKSVSLFIEKGSIIVSGIVDSLDYTSVTGTPGNDEYTANKKAEENIYGKIRNLQSQLKHAEINGGDTRGITQTINGLRDSIKTGRIYFISTHRNSPASAIYLYVLQDHLSIEQLESFYSNLSTDVKNISYVKMIPGKILARKRSAIGNTAPEFTATDINGKSFNLSDYRGKYVLLEFWASWCIPCREENPELIKAYQNYHEKGFVVIGISLDDKKDRWEKAIKEDQLPWIHTSELNAFENKLAKLYGVQPIPDNFLIDPKGQIIARQLSGKEVAAKLSQFIKQKL